ncbi:MAG: hypothetical protein KJ638_03560 [Chloroflexi bacterium]|nr:hypothetical protein [Chloroflexota bacterium]
MDELHRSRNPRPILIAGILFLFVLAACLPPPGGAPRSATGQNPWAEALRALDPADALTPSNDLTAVYLRPNGDDLQIRIDLLDFQAPGQVSLDVRIGDDSAPEAVPLDIHIPSESDSARISLDPLLATVIVDVPLSEIPAHPRVDISTPEDEITGLTLDGPIPTQYAPLLLTFYDTFAARFPTEALRSWDGAHTGPRGERHGLKHLLDAAKEYQVPIVLLDLKEPENLSALDAMGMLSQLKILEDTGLLILPEQPEQETLFGFSPSPFTWGGIPLRGTLTSRPTFASSNDQNHIYQPPFSKITIIPIATETETSQPTVDGPSLYVRRALLKTALNNDKNDLLVLGGGLRDSTWGSPDMTAVTLAYFASRPYVRILSAEDLINFPTTSGKPELRASPQDDSLSQLEAHYKNLTQPVLDFVANWKGSPLSSCATDLDKDNQPECILANGDFLAIFDPQGARLTYLFGVERDSISLYTHQLIGPSWQVAVGLSNPSTWDLTAGEAADPGAYPGAFADVDDPFKVYEASVDGKTIVFISKDGTRTKTFTLTETGLEVKYQTQEPITTQIPLLVDPDTRFTPDWAQKYTQQNTPSGVAWGLENGSMVRIQAEGLVKMRAFNESLDLLAYPEDPDFEYPPGHYVPFPMAIAEVEMQDGYFLRLERLP